MRAKLPIEKGPRVPSFKLKKDKKVSSGDLNEVKSNVKSNKPTSLERARVEEMQEMAEFLSP